MAWEKLLAYLALCFCLYNRLSSWFSLFLGMAQFVWPIPALKLFVLIL